VTIAASRFVKPLRSSPLRQSERFTLVLFSGMSDHSKLRHFEMAIQLGPSFPLPGTASTLARSNSV